MQGLAKQRKIVFPTPTRMSDGAGRKDHALSGKRSDSKQVNQSPFSTITSWRGCASKTVA